MSPGEVVKRARTDSGLTQAELARRMRTAQSAVARLEAPGSDPRWSTVVRALDAMSRDVSLAARPRRLPDVDEDQIRAYLRLTPSDRLRVHQTGYNQLRKALLNAG